MDTEDPIPAADRLALERTRLANERTLLAYGRTTIMLAATGVTLIKLYPDRIGWLVTGVVLVSIGVGISVTGVTRFRRLQRTLS